MIDSIEVQSRSREDVKHTLWIYEGVAKGCTCEARVYNPSVPCRHMNEYNERYILGEDLAPHVEDSIRSYEGCDYCGRNHKSWNCPF